MNFIGKTAIVTGGSRGIGKAIALKLAELGANIAVNYTSKPEEAEKVVAAIREMGREAIAIKADVSKGDDVQRLIDEVEHQFPTIDILVNNAGITRDTLLMRMKDEDWDQVIAINLKGTYNCTKAVTRKMMKQKSGKIVNIASVVGVMGNIGQSNYAASKAGIIGFTKSIAKELATRGINVNAVAPGFIQTNMTEVLSEEVKESLMTHIPMKQLGTPEDVANVVAFLCSDNARYITGQVLNVDGGMVM
ncbi:3-oxoacyl-[acyl-carrier-protein] reductase [Geosporobacter ferrireducens]|uniref:3-oxoacyl-[acyl-carrier-protein] reductase n=1 Tax=Geosporobacter ferrireducens TaxID=1424294 RepID=A0A1D8GBV8_9FIRM|nr:3-oxoacyl-[acyl-carrier-protein] reductase [Geosporobacter ferrireducens]AOT68394.1 3-oxoacyl-[acyl-carrier-protein] reductase [Geosporobacter ferrireducens]MTI53843.1 3-oxoacyl-[acyl-carrier-protein] reductase [Geosporobacter ferrireducens]